MAELLAYIRALLIGDATLLALFVAAGQDSVIACLPNQRDLAIYPTITYEHEQGDEYRSSDSAPKIFTGKFKLEIHTRQSAVDQSNYATMLSIKAQVLSLLIGNRLYRTEGIAGARLANGITICVFRAERPNGPGPTIDPTLCRWIIYFKTVLMEPN